MNAEFEIMYERVVDNSIKHLCTKFQGHSLISSKVRGLTTWPFVHFFFPTVTQLPGGRKKNSELSELLF